MTYLPWYKREGAVGCLVRWGEPERLGILLGSRVHLRPAAPEREPAVMLEVLDGLTQGVVLLRPWAVFPAPAAADV